VASFRLSMSGEAIVRGISDWQTGVLMILGSLIIGALLGVIAQSVVVFIIATVAAFGAVFFIYSQMYG